MVRAKTVENNPETFGAALQGAMQAEASQMMLASGLWGTRGSASGRPANNAMIKAIGGSGGGYVEMRECHNCHQVGHLARNCPKGSVCVCVCVCKLYILRRSCLAIQKIHLVELSRFSDP
jgi:hypothetical protein